MKSWLIFLSLLPAAAIAETFLVENGEPRAAIIIGEDSSRTTRLAAAELQETLEKISGAKLPITNTPSDGVAIYVGESEHAQKLGVTADGLEHGAYRMKSGDNWLALIGEDTEFEPIEPWATNNGGREKLQPRWEEASGLPYGVPNGGMYKNRRRMPEELAKEDGEFFWGMDERGSYNAVCGFLRSLGARWYLPGELGEVLPDMPTIPLPSIDETTKPDFEIRQFSVRIGNTDDEVTRWVMRLGIRQIYGLMIAHGMHTMTHPEQLKTDKPDWFALYGGKRDTETGKRLNHLCYSNEELFVETVKWARAQFDVYDYEAVSIMPPDAYGSICQCELCEGKQIDEMGARGKLSNHVWDFANRVAKEVGKTHPDKFVGCCAYGANTEVPTNIDKLEPNVQVIIVGGRRPRNSLPEQREYVDNLREGWMQLTDQPIIIFENYPFTGRGTYLPAFVARTNAQSINATKGLSRGEDIWLSFPRFHDDPAMGFDHFQIYTTARMWWGGKDADVGAMLEEYCNTFYGDAGPTMLKFFDFCEANYQAMEDALEPVETALAMFEEAKSCVKPDSVYAKRLDLIDEFLNALRSKAEQLGQGRGPVARMRTVWEPKEPIVVDGKLDDDYWVRHREWSVTRLRELQTGGQPVFGTTVMAGWDRSGQNVYFAIRCDERPGEKLNITATKHDDEAIWYGDVVEILLDTDANSYYQIAVNPAGALADLDRGVDKSARFRWESQAEVATHVAEDHWVVEIRIPVTEDENDPFNHVIGRKPSQSLPWHFNVCRQRARENGTELSAVSPTGASGFHVPLKFGHFYDGRSHAFDVDETVTDFLIEYSAAAGLLKDRKHEEAMAAFLALAEHEEATDLQKSRSLAQAALCARALKNVERAIEIPEGIPVEAIRKTEQMYNFHVQRLHAELIKAFGDDSFVEWPFWQAGLGAYLRGRSYFVQKDGAKAEADFQFALKHTTDDHARVKILNSMGSNRQNVLNDRDGALEAFLKVTEVTRLRGNSEFHSAIINASRILRDQSRYKEALEVLDLVEAEKLGGMTAGMILLSKGEALAGAGQKEEALKVFRAVANSDSATKSQVEMANSGIQKLDR